MKILCRFNILIEKEAAKNKNFEVQIKFLDIKKFQPMVSHEL